ncbi:hypothetical protein NQ317_007581 [Molorchus minor]|uniref:Uncharacterized protein n=1 Tax=Molorchus minor TaxID=1323400 RepID=A0ABQ9JEL9_9CUCU|nr:hypothetical protein NQ317_007581 [Molorchus minor]
MKIPSDDGLSSTPPNLIDATNSQIKQIKANKARKISENMLLAYVAEKSKKVKSSTLWAIYSILKLTLRASCMKLETILKKSKVLTREEVNQFIREADDETYLMVKVHF